MRVARNATAIAVSTLLARGLQFIWSIILARVLGEAGYGMWGTIGGMFSIAATLPEFGMGMIVLRDVARDRALAGPYLAATLTVQPLLAVAAYVLLMGAALLFPNTPEIRVLLALAGINLLVDVLGTMGYNQLLAVEHMVSTSVILVTHITLLIIFAVVVIASGGGLAGLYISSIMAGAFRAVLFWNAMRRAGIRPVWPVQTKVVVRLLREGLPIALSSFFSLAYHHIDKILALTLLTQEDAGYLVSAFIIVFGVVELLNNTFLVALFPSMSRMAGTATRTLHSMTEQFAYLTLVITLPAAVGVGLLAERLSGLLFPGFRATSAVLEILIWHSVAMMVGNVFAQELVIQNRQTQMVVIRVVGLIANIALNLLLLPVLGIQGAGLAILVAQCLILVLLIVAHRPTGDSLHMYAGKSARTLLAGAFMGTSIGLLRDVNAALAGLVGLLVYGSALVLLRALAPQDWSVVWTVVRSLPLVGKRLERLIPG